MLEDPIQNIELDNCSPFQLYFCEKRFGGNAESQTFEQKRLTKNTIEVFLDEIFSLDTDNNEKGIGEYITKKGIKFE